MICWLPLKNVFNEQYARDISRKVRGAIQSKQQQGQFIGAFASYGYRKDPENRNKLQIDPCAAAVVQRVFDLYEQGNGKIKIAKLLNAEGIPCPSEYKKLNGEHYHNGQKLGKNYLLDLCHHPPNAEKPDVHREYGTGPRTPGRPCTEGPSNWTVASGPWWRVNPRGDHLPSAVEPGPRRF